MKPILFDTCILIDLLRRNTAAAEYFKDINAELAISVVTIQEIITGERDHEREITQVLLDGFRVVPMDERIAYRSGRLMRQYGKSHGLDPNDSVIAATALEYGYELSTRNVKHFPMIGGLQKPY